jgi:hypothetical protein
MPRRTPVNGRHGRRAAVAVRVATTRSLTMDKPETTPRDDKLCRILMVVKFLLGIPCVLWGMLIGVIGLGPDGPVPLDWRLTGLCFLVGGAGVCYPFSVVARRGAANWLIVACTTPPFLARLIAFINYPEAWTPIGDTAALIPFVIVVSLPLLSLAELVSSGKFREQCQTEDTTIDSDSPRNLSHRD